MVEETRSVALGRPATRVVRPVPAEIRGRRIVIVDDNPVVLSHYRRRLITAGFASVDAATGAHGALKLVAESHPDVALIDIHLGEREHDGIDLLAALRAQGFTGHAVAFSGDQTIGQIYRALAAGADDFWVKGPDLNPAYEVVDLLTRPPPSGEAKWEPENLARLGFWRTIGATDGEIASIVEYARSFGHYDDVADSVGRSHVQLRKTISNLKQKCEVKSLAELGQLLTLCTMMGCRPPPRDDAPRRRRGS
jgi:CheY-like chemotaxis protein